MLHGIQIKKTKICPILGIKSEMTSPSLIQQISLTYPLVFGPAQTVQ